MPPAKEIQVQIAKTEEVTAPTAPVESTYLLPGRTVSSQLQPLAIASGWQLAWEAADFTVDQKTALSSDFVKAISTLTESANANGIHIKVTFYQGNKIARVTEY
jgi:hypothetical protein